MPLVTPESLLSRILDHCWSSKNIHALVLEYSYQDLPKLPDQPFDIPPSTDEEICTQDLTMPSPKEHTKKPGKAKIELYLYIQDACLLKLNSDIKKAPAARLIEGKWLSDGNMILKSGVPDVQQATISGTDEGLKCHGGQKEAQGQNNYNTLPHIEAQLVHNGLPTLAIQCELKSDLRHQRIVLNDEKVGDRMKWSREDDDDEDDTEDDDDDNDGNDDGDDDDNDGNDDYDDDDSHHERTESDKDENLNLNQSTEEHEEDEEEYVDEFTDKEDDADNANEENEEELDNAK
ncbi:hypothetical protein Tco_1300373 [Tanacetum coccineum]